MDRVREAPTLVKIGVPIVLVLIVVGAVAGGGKSGTTDSSPGEGHPNSQPVAERRSKDAAKAEEDAEQKAEVAARTEAEAKKAEAERKSSPQQKIAEALGDSVSSSFAVGDSEVRSVKVRGQFADITLSTPEGGFEGPSTQDTDGLVSAALAKVYGDGDWQGAAYVEFRGGLVDSATGRDLPKAPTVSYRIESRAARQIDWSDEEALYNIDWGIYRAFCHPAIKGCN